MKYESPFHEQWNRIVRLRQILDKYDEATDDNFEEALDAFTNFFIQCYHLRDWLIESGYDKRLVDQHIGNSCALSLCRDLSNTQSM